jgi:uncharacterized oxidoreductase
VSEDLVWTFEQAVAVGSDLLAALGTPRAAAEVVARSLAGANLCGHDSHGLVRLPWYAEFVADGRARPNAVPEVVRHRGAVAVVDGNRCWGQLAGGLAVEVAAKAAREHGVGAVTVRRANHLGRLGEYCENLAEDGLAAVCWANADPAVAPFGGRDRMLGTNPFAAAVPGDGREPPVIVDFATSAVAEGKLRLERMAGRAVPSGLIQDARGRPSNDPEDYYAGGALLPFGQHKGFGLALMVELLGGGLSGNHVGFLPEYEWGNGFLLLALDPGAFADPGAFREEMARACARLRSSPPADGVEQVLLPGDIEAAVRKRRLAQGIPIPPPVHSALVDCGHRLGVSIP